MRPKFPAGCRAWCFMLSLMWGTAVFAAEQHPLIGATREQVLSRYGEPKSTVAGANLELFFYEREKLTLRGGRVVEVERISSEPSRRPTTPSTTPTPAPAAESSAPPPTPAEAQPTQAPGQTGDPAAATSAPASGGEPKLAIKRVLPPGASSSTPPPAKSSAPATSAAQAPQTATVSPGGPGAAPSPTVPTGPLPPQSSPAATPVAGKEKAGATVQSTTPPPAETAVTTPPEDPVVGEKKDSKKKKIDFSAARRRLEQAETEEEDPTQTLLTPRTYAITAAIIAAALAYFAWQRRQRRIELEATALSRTPFSAPVASSAGNGTVFTSNLLAKLEWKRFEELVAAYYSKTGVVATRTKNGPAAPVHIKISWKGETRPFALVQCLAHPVGLVDAKPLQELFAVLTAEDIRRGYVVTTGKFSIPARDLAEEKHITLLPGDIFLEKLNALPDAARAELMQQVTAGDNTTPSCPKCEAPMVKSSDDPAMWRCAAHPDQQLPARG